MENMNTILAANIQRLRKKNGFTQEELAGKLGVTFQAVSKWETAKSAPDIGFLPTMADVFGCSIDELFSREGETGSHYDLFTEFPWKDNGANRGVVYRGKKVRVNGNAHDEFDIDALSAYLKKAVPNDDSTSKLLNIVADSLTGTFELTDKNIDLMLDAYKDLYKGMLKKE